MSLLLLVMLLGPAETLSGKYPRHSPEFLQRYAQEVPDTPDPLPKAVDPLCALIEQGRAEPPVYAALGEALLQKGDTALAYRAFRKAQVLSEDAIWRRSMQERKEACTFVPDAVIEAEEREAGLWVDALQEYERERIARGEDPRDLAPFYARFGAPEDKMGSAMRDRRAGALLTVAAALLIIAAVIGLLVWRRRQAA